MDKRILGPEPPQHGWESRPDYHRRDALSFCGTQGSHRSNQHEDPGQGRGRRWVRSERFCE